MKSGVPRTVLVTGGASGIGLAVCRAFADRGDRVVSLDVRESAAADVSVIGDVTVAADNARAVAEAGDSLGVLVANAGVHDGGAGFDRSGDDLAAIARKVLEVNVLGYVMSIHAAAPVLKLTTGSIVLTLSDASFLVGQQGAGVAYTASKHAALSVMKWAARDLAPDVRVNAVAPGGVITGLAAVGADGSERALFDDAEAKRASIRSRNPLGTLLEPDEVAAHYVWLASPAAKAMTGEVIRLDGGLSVR